MPRQENEQPSTSHNFVTLSDSLVQVHSLKSLNTGGILDPDDEVAAVADDREQIVAIFDEQDSPPQSCNAIYANNRFPHSTDGTSASSAGTSSPDTYPTIFNGNSITTNADGGAGGRRVLDKPRTNGYYANKHYFSPTSMDVMSTSTDLENGNMPACSRYHLLTISQGLNGNGKSETINNVSAKKEPSAIHTVDQDHLVEIVDFNEPPNAGLIVVSGNPSHASTSSEAIYAPVNRAGRDTVSSSHLTPTKRTDFATPTAVSKPKHVRIASADDASLQQKWPTHPNLTNDASGNEVVTLNGSLPHGFSQFQRNSARKSRITDKWLDAAERAEETFWDQHCQENALDIGTEMRECTAVPDAANAFSPVTELCQSEVENIVVTLPYDSGRQFGLHTVESFDELASRFDGLRICGIEPNSRVSKDGRLQLEDRIVIVDRQQLEAMHPSEAQQFLNSAANSGAVTLNILRHKQKISSTDRPLPPSPIYPLRLSVPRTGGLISTAADSPCALSEALFSTSTPQTSTGAEPLDSPLKPSGIVGLGTGLADTLQRSNTRKIGRKLTVSLAKGSEGLGFTVTSRDNFASSDNPICIKTILPRGAAIVDGRLKAGDRLLEINGVEVVGKDQDDVVAMLRQIKPGSKVELVVSRQETTLGSPLLPRPMHDGNTEEAGAATASTEQKNGIRLKEFTFDIPLSYTGSAGLGISVKGRRHASDAPCEVGAAPQMVDMGIFIRAILRGGAAYNDGRLLVNDQLVSVNGEDLTGCSNDQATERLRRMMPSIGASANSVKLTILRLVNANGVPVSGSPHSSSTESPIPADNEMANQTVTFGHSVPSESMKPFAAERDTKAISSESPKRPNGYFLGIAESPLPRYNIPGRGDYAIIHKSPTINMPQKTNIEIVNDSPPPSLPPRSISSGQGESVSANVSAFMTPPLARHLPRTGPTSSRSAGNVPDIDLDNYELIPETQVHGSKSEPAIYDEVDGSAFDREAPGRQSMSEKRKGAAKLDPTHTQTYQRIKAAKHERQPSAPTILDASSQNAKNASLSLSKATGSDALQLVSAGAAAAAAADYGSNKIRRSLSLESVSVSGKLAVSDSRTNGDDQSRKTQSRPSNSPGKPTAGQKQRPFSQFFPGTNAAVGESGGGGKKVSRARPTNDSFKRAVDRSYINGHLILRGVSPNGEAEKGVDIGAGELEGKGRNWKTRDQAPEKSDNKAGKEPSTANLFKNLFRIRDKRSNDSKASAASKKEGRSSLLIFGPQSPNQKPRQPHEQEQPKVTKCYEDEQRRIREELEKLKRTEQMQQRMNSSTVSSEGDVWSKRMQKQPSNWQPEPVGYTGNQSRLQQAYGPQAGCYSPWQKEPPPIIQSRKDYEDASVSGIWALDNRLPRSTSDWRQFPPTSTGVGRSSPHQWAHNQFPSRVEGPQLTPPHRSLNMNQSSSEANSAHVQNHPRRSETDGDLQRNESPLRILANGAEGKFQRNGSLSTNRPSTIWAQYCRGPYQSSSLERPSRRMDKNNRVECQVSQPGEVYHDIITHHRQPHHQPSTTPGISEEQENNSGGSRSNSRECPVLDQHGTVNVPAVDYEKLLRQNRRVCLPCRISPEATNGPSSRKSRPTSNFVEYSRHRNGHAVPSGAESNHQQQFSQLQLARHPVRSQHAMSTMFEYPSSFDDNGPAPPIPERRHGITLPATQYDSAIIEYPPHRSAEDTHQTTEMFRRPPAPPPSTSRNDMPGVRKLASGFRSSGSSGSGPPVPPKPSTKACAGPGIPLVSKSKGPVKIETYEFHQKTTVMKTMNRESHHCRS